MPITLKSLWWTCSIASYVCNLRNHRSHERWFRRFKCGNFDTRQKGRQGTWNNVKKFEVVELQELSGENDSQTLKQLAEQLNVNQQAISNSLWEMGMIQKTGRWVSRELNNRHIEKRKNIWHFVRSLQEEVVFTSNSDRERNVDLFWESQVQEIVGSARRTIHIDRKTESALAERRCFVFGRTRRAWSIMRC